MKVIYETVMSQIGQAVAKATRLRKRIDHIELDHDEWRALQWELSNSIPIKQQLPAIGVTEAEVYGVRVELARA